MSVNKVILVGRLGKDPVTKTLEGSNQKLTKFSIATDERWKDKSGEKQQRTEWHNITVWGKLAEICGQYLAKGSLVYIEGKIQSRQYEKDGVKHTAVDIVASDMKMLGSKGDSEPASAGATTEGSPTATPIADDDIPF